MKFNIEHDFSNVFSEVNRNRSITCGTLFENNKFLDTLRHDNFTEIDFQETLKFIAAIRLMHYCLSGKDYEKRNELLKMFCKSVRTKLNETDVSEVEFSE